MRNVMNDEYDGKKIHIAEIKEHNGGRYLYIRLDHGCNQVFMINVLFVKSQRE